MSIPERRARSKESVKLQILKAAKELFIEKGFRETSVRNIAEKIEYSPTTIYLYYKDKNDIFRTIHNDGFQLLRERMKVLFNVHNPFERLQAMCRFYVDFAIENKELYELMFILEAPIDSINSAHEAWGEGQDVFGILNDTVSACFELGCFKGYACDDLSFTIWAAVHGMSSLQIKNRCEKVFVKEKAETILQQGVETLIKFLKQIK